MRAKTPVDGLGRPLSGSVEADPAPSNAGRDGETHPPPEHDGIAIVLGTRPEIIKLAPVIELLGRRAHVVHTGQHFDAAMSDRVSLSMGTRRYRLRLDVGGKSRGGQLGAAVAALDRFFDGWGPRAVVVQGDTTSALAGALAANAGGHPLVHVEAGLRSYDRRMPEEHNRVLIDHLSDLCCAPTSVSRDNLLAEGIAKDRIAVTGNTVVEAVAKVLPDTAAREALQRAHAVKENQYVLVTLHRPENVDAPEMLRTLLTELGRAPMPVLFVVHPRTRSSIVRFGLGPLLAPLRIADPLDYPEFLALAAGAALIVSDSGGLQEEASILKRPIIVVRQSTERPEIQGTFGALVPPGDGLGHTIRHWLSTAEQRRLRLAGLHCPYGDGYASHRVVEELRKLLHGPEDAER
ncbi:UDP-N-acetylglucosamine 2-epimerase (non-hydrolyzing) [Streptomyces sp. PmtG]